MLEQTESFKVLLKRTPGLHPEISLIQAEGIVNIVNDDGKLCMSLLQARERH